MRSLGARRSEPRWFCDVKHLLPLAHLNLLHVLFPPIEHLHDNWSQAGPEFSQRVFDPGGYFFVDFPVDDAILLEFPQLSREHPLGHLRQESSQFIEAFRAFEQVVQDDGFPLPTNNICGRFHCAAILARVNWLSHGFSLSLHSIKNDTTAHFCAYLLKYISLYILTDKTGSGRSRACQPFPIWSFLNGREETLCARSYRLLISEISLSSP
jgi:hypothetical protein